MTSFKKVITDNITSCGEEFEKQLSRFSSLCMNKTPEEEIEIIDLDKEFGDLQIKPFAYISYSENVTWGLSQLDEYGVKKRFSYLLSLISEDKEMCEVERRIKYDVIRYGYFLYLEDKKYEECMESISKKLSSDFCSMIRIIDLLTPKEPKGKIKSTILKPNLVLSRMDNRATGFERVKSVIRAFHLADSSTHDELFNKMINASISKLETAYNLLEPGFEQTVARRFSKAVIRQYFLSIIEGYALYKALGEDALDDDIFKVFDICVPKGCEEVGIKYLRDLHSPKCSDKEKLARFAEAYPEPRKVSIPLS